MRIVLNCKFARADNFEKKFTTTGACASAATFRSPDNSLIFLNFWCLSIRLRPLEICIGVTRSVESEQSRELPKYQRVPTHESGDSHQSKCITIKYNYFENNSDILD